MAQTLNSSPLIHQLASDLGLGLSADPVGAIANHCEKRVQDLMSSFQECATPMEMLDCLSNMLGTSFEVIRTDEDLRRVRRKYLDKGELRFAALEEELSGDQDFGITLRLGRREPWELEYVSVIDCRGGKCAREYFTKWHELAHLLALTDKTREGFRRSHSSGSFDDPAERLMDVLAGRFGFYAPIVRRHTAGEMSFEAVNSLREQLCPEASFQSALINFVKFWSSPCVLVHAKMALKKDQEAKVNQGCFSFHAGPEPALRAVHVTNNEAGREAGLLVIKNWRVPETSVIHRSFADGIRYCEAEENLSWWESSDGKRLADIPVFVKVRRSTDSVDALITPVH